MTRWAKAGSSQKHKKVPEGATPWEELSKNVKGKFKSKLATHKKHRKPNQKQIVYDESASGINTSSLNVGLSNEGGVEKFCIEEKAKGHNQSPFTKQIDEHGKKNVKLEKDSISFETEKLNQQSLSGEQISEFRGKKRKLKREKDTELLETQKMHHESLSMNQSNELGEKRKKFKLEKDNESFETKIMSNHESNEANTSNEHVQKNEDFESLNKKDPEGLQVNKLSNRQKKKLEKQKYRLEKDQKISSEKSGGLSQSNSRKFSAKKQFDKKQIILEKRKQRRKELGIMLLPQNIENRIYRIKKSLRKKNFPPEKIIDIIREERRKAQNEFKKTQVTKMCFNCREFGHLVVNCPTLKSEDGPETGICFKCGSTEHTSARCKKKVTGFPFASCFICKAHGHISRDCPNNKHGIYPKGGKCNLCDSINHLRKDCPMLKKKKEEETSITLHTIDKGATIDDEIIDSEEAPKETKSKRPKVVKF